MQSLVSLLLLALLCAGLTTAKLERLEDRKARYARDANFIHPAEEDRHLTQEEVLKSLPAQSTRQRRQTSDPHTNGRHEFLDGYRYGSIHYSGDQSQVIFVLTYNVNQDGPTATNLYRSLDYGVTFDNIESNLDPNAINPLIWYSFFVSPVNKNMLVFAGFPDSRIYYTLDEGDTWTIQDFNPSTIDPRTLKFSPKEDNWILAHDPDNEYLYVSTDLGGSWTLVAPFVDHSSDYQWGELGWETDDSTIYFNQFDADDPQRENHTVSLYTQHYPYGSATQEEFDPNLGRHEAFLLLGPYIFVQKTESNGDAYLLVSYNRQTFNMAQIPTPYAHKNYFVAHIEERQALVIVEHDGGFYNLYLSDESGVYYSLSLRDIVIINAVDLEMIEGVNGTMIANQYVRDDPSETDAPIRTIITLDNGGNWELIHPPDVDVYGNQVNCEPPSCSLHFHMDTSLYARLGVFSTESAPGIIVAHGTLGETLTDDPDLYISRDGGVSWHETLTGSYGVNILDHGGVIVAANDYHQSASTDLMYSCNEGLSWNTYEFTDTTITIFGVITEPGELTTIVSFYGVESGGATWVVVTVDFYPIFSRDCTDDDYYDWLPWDDRSDTDCILGSSIVIERRNIDTCCRNGHNYVRETQYTVCECNEEDFECDYGYARPGEDLSGLCVRDPDVQLDDPCANENTTTYTASTGYRKIAGDVCRGGAEAFYAPFEAECCDASTQAPTQNTPDTPITYTQPTDKPTESPSAAPSSQDSSNTAMLAGLGALVGVVSLAAVGLVAGVIILALKYASLKKRTSQLVGSGNTQTFRFTSDRDTQEYDEDDAPLIP